MASFTSRSGGFDVLLIVSAKLCDRERKSVPRANPKRDSRNFMRFRISFNGHSEGRNQG
jgi:hypothetical protein